MAEAMPSDQSSLKDAILRVWTPAFGEQSFQRLKKENLQEILRNMIFQEEEAPLAFSWYVEVFCKNNYETDVAKFFESQGPFQLESALVSGSWSEGLFIYFESSVAIAPPDLDFMCVLRNIKFTINDQLNGNLTVKEDTPFVNAYITDEEGAKLWKDFLHDFSTDYSSNKHQISSLKLKKKLSGQIHSNPYSKSKSIFSDEFYDEHYRVYSESGSAAFKVASNKPAEVPAIFNTDSIRSLVNALHKSVPDFLNELAQHMAQSFDNLLPSCDIVLALKCDGWPLCATEWITRKRTWPDKVLIETIAQNGFHIVPKSSPEGDFRLSFSVAETTLIRHLSPLQHKVVKCLKGVVKYHQNSWSTNFKKIVKTYHLKTIALWYCERTTQDSFTEESVALHLVLLLQELADALRKRELPMYFMPKVNLFQSVENCEELIDIVDKIITLSRNYIILTETVEKVAKLSLHLPIKGLWSF